MTLSRDVGSEGRSLTSGSGMKARETDEVAKALPSDSTLRVTSPFHCLYCEAKTPSLGNWVGLTSSV